MLPSQREEFQMAHLVKNYIFKPCFLSLIFLFHSRKKHIYMRFVCEFMAKSQLVEMLVCDNNCEEESCILPL